MDFGVEVCKSLWILTSKWHDNFKVSDFDDFQRGRIQFIGKRLEGWRAKMQGWMKA